MVPRKVRYSVHPAVAYNQAIIENIPAKTGKSLKEWAGILRGSGVGEEEFPAFLKAKYGIGGTTAVLLADIALGKTKEYSDPGVYLKQARVYIEEMYQGKEQLRPIHDLLLQLVLALGKDVRICPCKTLVPLYRKNVFAQIKPTTKTRIDFGLALKGSKKKPGKRLVDTGGLAKGDRITHRIPLKSLTEVDAELKEWLQISYELCPPG